jgi:hypothetical protein
VGDVAEDDEFLDVTIMTINAKGVPKKYEEIIQYLDVRFLVKVTKAMRT